MIRRARHAINDLRAEIEPRLPRRGTLRWLWAGEHGERQSGPLDQLLGAFPFIATAWLFAWLEIYATTMDAIKEQFSCDRRPPFPRDTGCAPPLRGVRCRRRYDDMGFALGRWQYLSGVHSRGQGRVPKALSEAGPCRFVLRALFPARRCGAPCYPEMVPILDPS